MSRPRTRRTSCRGRFRCHRACTRLRTRRHARRARRPCPTSNPLDKYIPQSSKTGFDLHGILGFPFRSVGAWNSICACECEVEDVCFVVAVVAVYDVAVAEGCHADGSFADYCSEPIVAVFVAPDAVELVLLA